MTTETECHGQKCCQHCNPHPDNHLKLFRSPERPSRTLLVPGFAVERAVARFVEDYNHRRYHEALQNVTPADAFHGRQAAILARPARIKQRTLPQRKRETLHVPPHVAIRSGVSL